MKSHFVSLHRSYLFLWIIIKKEVRPEVRPFAYSNPLLEEHQMCKVDLPWFSIQLWKHHLKRTVYKPILLLLTFFPFASNICNETIMLDHVLHFDPAHNCYFICSFDMFLFCMQNILTKTQQSTPGHTQNYFQLNHFVRIDLEFYLYQ